MHLFNIYNCLKLPKYGRKYNFPCVERKMLPIAQIHVAMIQDKWSKTILEHVQQLHQVVTQKS